MLTREATLEKLPLEILVEILLYLSANERDAKPGYGKHHRSMGALICSFSAARAAAFNLTRQQLLNVYFWAHHPNVIKLFNHPRWIQNFYFINSRLNAINPYIKENAINELDLFCLTGQMDLIEEVIARRVKTPFSVGRMRRYCFLAAVSENPAALQRLCDEFRFSVHVLAPLPVHQAAHIPQHAYLPAVTKNNSVLQIILLHGTAGALKCINTIVPSQHISEFILGHKMMTHIASHLVNDRMNYVASDTNYLSLVLSFCNTPQHQPSLQTLQHTLLDNAHIELYKIVQKHFIDNSLMPDVDTLLKILILGNLALFKEYLNSQPHLKRKIITNQNNYGFKLFYEALKFMMTSEIIVFFITDLQILKVFNEKQLQLILHRAVVGWASSLKLLLAENSMASLARKDEKELLSKLIFSMAQGNLLSRCENIVVILDNGTHPDLIFSNHNYHGRKLCDELHNLASESCYWFAVRKMVEKGLNLSIYLPDNDNMTVCEKLFTLTTRIPEDLLLKFINHGMSKSNSWVRYMLDTCLWDACTHKRYTCIDVLIKAGARIKATCRFVVPCGRALIAEEHIPAFNNFFAEYGPKGRVEGCTALDLAIAAFNYDAVKAIIDNSPRAKLQQLITTKRLYNFWVDEKVPEFTTMDLALGLGDERIIALLNGVLDLQLQASPQPFMM